MALFGLSPLFLSVLASTWFTNNAGDLEVTNFVAFMAILAGSVHIIGAINLRTPDTTKMLRSTNNISRRLRDSCEDHEGAHAADERTPLVQISSASSEQRQSVLDLLKDPYFLLLGSLVLVALGTVSTISL